MPMRWDQALLLLMMMIIIIGFFGIEGKKKKRKMCLLNVVQIALDMLCVIWEAKLLLGSLFTLLSSSALIWSGSSLALCSRLPHMFSHRLFWKQVPFIHWIGEDPTDRGYSPLLLQTELKILLIRLTGWERSIISVTESAQQWTESAPDLYYSQLNRCPDQGFVSIKGFCISTIGTKKDSVQNNRLFII